MKQELHPLFRTIVALAGLGLTIWEAVGRSNDPRFPLLIIYVVMMGLVSPQALERILDRFVPGVASNDKDDDPPTPSPSLKKEMR